MFGPGEYVPDITEGITSVEDLPKPRLERRSRNYTARRCRRCGRYAVASRILLDRGDPRSDRPVDLVVIYSKHYFLHCDHYFSVDLSDLALPKCLYTRRVQQRIVRLVAEDGLGSRMLRKAHRISAEGQDRAGKPLKILSPVMQKVFGSFGGRVSIQRSPPRWIDPGFVDKAVAYLTKLE
jgi:hypothetical protein